MLYSMFTSLVHLVACYFSVSTKIQMLDSLPHRNLCQKILIEGSPWSSGVTHNSAHPNHFLSPCHHSYTPSLQCTITTPVNPYAAPPSISIIESFQVAVNAMDEGSPSNSSSSTSKSQTLQIIIWADFVPNLTIPWKQH